MFLDGVFAVKGGVKDFVEYLIARRDEPYGEKAKQEIFNQKRRGWMRQKGKGDKCARKDKDILDPVIEAENFDVTLYAALHLRTATV